MAEKVLLKKYANRRLYDTQKSAYVSLHHISDLIKSGRQVQVIDATTEEDVTGFILTQIILEEAKRKNTLLPVPLLHLIIQYGENVLSEFFDRYLELTIKNYLSYKSAFDDQFRKWLDAGMDIADLAQKTLPGFTRWDSFLDLFSDSARRREQDKPAEDNKPPPTDSR